MDLLRFLLNVLRLWNCRFKMIAVINAFLMIERTNVDWPIPPTPSEQEADRSPRAGEGTEAKTGFLDLNGLWQEQVRLGKLTQKEYEERLTASAGRDAEVAELNAQRSAEIRGQIRDYKSVAGVTYAPGYRESQGPDSDEENAKIIDLKELEMGMKAMEEKSRKPITGKPSAWERVKSFFKG